MGYEVLLFDADGTLFDYHQAEAYAFEKTFRSFFKGEPNHYLPEYQLINQAIWEEFEAGLIQAQDVNQERFHRFLTQMDLPADALAVSQQYIHFLSQASFLLDGAREVLTALTDYEKVLITNGLSSVQHARLLQADLKDFFSSLIISQEVGVAKPHAGIFLKALESIHHSKKETVLMIGDALHSDIQGGVEFGIATCWFNPNREENGSPWIPTYEIHHLQELPELLGRIG